MKGSERVRFENVDAATRARAIEEAKRLGLERPEHALAQCGAVEQGRGPLQSVEWAELALVAAVAAGDVSALAVFDREFLRPAARVVAQHRRVDEQELAQLVRSRLLIGDGVARLRSWSGRGRLAAWLKAVAVRLACTLGAERRPSPDEVWEVALRRLTCGATPELLFAERSQRMHVHAALDEALRRLPRREKVVLRLHVFHALGTEQLGQVFHVAPSTVRRWIQGARCTVFDQVRTTLSQRSGWSNSEIDSALARLSTLEVSRSALASDVA